MKIYAFHEGCKYEGGGTVSLHRSYDGALKAAYKAAKEKSDSMIAYSKESGYDYIDWSLKEIKNGFEVASDIYIVCEMVVEE